MSLPAELVADLHLSDLAVEPVWPSAMVAGAAHYSEAEPRELRSPIDGSVLGRYAPATVGIAQLAVEAAHGAFLKWRVIPAPLRGELVRRIAEEVRLRRAALATLIVLEVGKTPAEAEAEVQVWIDSCDYAHGLSRQLHGLTIPSEAPRRRIMEQWHPLGAIGLITPFNFPIGSWAGHAMIALVCGDTIVWKPSEKAPLCAIAVQRLVESVVDDMEGHIPAHVCQLLQGDAETGSMIAAHPALPLIAATGTCVMGRAVAVTVAGRLGRSSLLLGGNNAFVVTESADLDLTVETVLTAVCHSAGQRCTSLRRLIVQESVIDKLTHTLARAFDALRVGDPRHDGVQMGPLIDAEAWWKMQSTLQAIEQQGGRLIAGGHRVESGVPHGGYYVRPALVRVDSNLPAVCEETFAPILYVMPYGEMLDALDLHNGVPQGLSSAIFTRHLGDAEAFLGPAGSDCGIANVNMSTGGLEIGAAFGGEKDSGAGRAAGADAWKTYMRRATNHLFSG